MKFNKILLPVDLSESSPKIVPFVASMAEKFGSKIHILFVARVFQYFKGIYVPHPSIDQFENEIVEGARKSLKEFTGKHFKDPQSIVTAVVKGDAAEQIIKYIEDQGIDLLIMGTHGRKGLDKVIFGSVAEKLSKTTPVPIMLVNPYKVK
ncbi:MAG: universal stress protein [Proteobacteria bacterium]|nr:universal stress protein [Pseudomonadota bacterium]MBU1570475.1 universal stress protein [Pseudomonadota bacterium]